MGKRRRPAVSCPPRHTGRIAVVLQMRATPSWSKRHSTAARPQTRPEAPALTLGLHGPAELCDGPLGPQLNIEIGRGLPGIVEWDDGDPVAPLALGQMDLVESCHRRDIDRIWHGVDARGRYFRGQAGRRAPRHPRGAPPGRRRCARSSIRPALRRRAIAPARYARRTFSFSEPPNPPTRMGDAAYNLWLPIGTIAGW